MLIETIPTLVLDGLETNCYLLADPESLQGIIIDPGGDPEPVLHRIRELRVTITLIVNTHGHFDHTGGNQALAAATGASIAAHAEARPLFETRGGAALFGLPQPASPMPTRWLQDGDTVTFGTHTLLVLHTPGHTPGCISLWDEAAGVVFDGDLLFHTGIGRTDLPGGNYRLLMQSIHRRILTLPPHTIVYPGHGPSTVVECEARSNPYLEQRPEWL